MQQLLPLVAEVIRLRKVLATDSTDLATYHRVAGAYLAFANADAAMLYLKKSEKAQ